LFIARFIVAYHEWQTAVVINDDSHAYFLLVSLTAALTMASTL